MRAGKGSKPSGLTPLYSTQQAAEFLGVHRTTLNRLRARKVNPLRGYKVGGQWRYRQEDLEAAMVEGGASGTRAAG